jgi:protein-S-isoprenylcysteine O-methyltransferase Ste14
MTLIPDFEFGLWNAWIIVAGFLVLSFAPFFVGGDRADARMRDEPKFSETAASARLGIVITHVVLMPGTLVYSFFVPLERGNWWLYSGLIVAGLGVVVALAASIAFTTAPVHDPMTRGVYAISRNPMYVAGFLVYVGVGLAAASWVFLACGVIEIAAYRMVVVEEERTMIGKYGPAYERYMLETPRWIGPPKARQASGAG